MHERPAGRDLAIVIVAVHNQLGHSALSRIQRYTTGPYEVIVIDNHSSDGSAEFFEANGCRVIRNDRTMLPRIDESRIRRGEREFLCHINNDLYVAPGWNGFLSTRWATSAAPHRRWAGNDADRLLTDWMQDAGRRRAGRLSSGKGIDQLRTMIQAMAGDWERYCGRTMRFAGTMFEGSWVLRHDQAIDV
jgi:glycosyltransferase involved in cell wall biosynthesis